MVSALIALETNRDAARLPVLLGALIELLRAQGDAELTRAFQAWVEQVLLPRRFRGMPSESLPRLEEVRTMLAEQVKEWTAEWVAEGRAQGQEQGRAEERALLCRMAARKFGRGHGAAAGRRAGGRCPILIGWRRWASGSSNAGRRRTCSPASGTPVPVTEFAIRVTSVAETSVVIAGMEEDVLLFF